MSTQPSPLASTVTDAAPSSIQLPPQDSTNSDGTQLPQAPAPPSGGPSRLMSTLASIVSAGLASVPNKGRATFVTGLGNGARAEQASEANQQDIKFKTFDDQIRIAQLHNQDLALQNATQEQADAHESHMQAMHANDGDWGIKYDTIANNGDAVMDHLRTQTAANGAAVVPPGTHISGDGETILIPQDTPETNAGQLQQFKTVAPALGMNVTIPNGATKLDPKVATVFYNKLQGFDPNGNPYTADVLPALIASNQARRDELAKQGATPKAALDALDGIIAKQKAHLQADNDAADAASQRKIDQQNAINNNKADNTKDINASKPKNSQSTDWVPKVSADEKKKAELAENIAFNANEVAGIIMRRPDLFGAAQGRVTTAEQMMGNNDPDISALGTHIHNMAMANSGVHGFRSQEGVESYEKQLLNNFRNGPSAVAGALRASVGSVQTFVDNARPDTYKTHSKNGGAIRGMMQKQGGQ